MNIGNRVRLLKGREEGIVSRIIDDKLIEVEIEDGFNIPVLKKEVVIISQQEESAFGKKTAPEPIPKKSQKPAITTKGIYLALVPINDKRLSLHFINNTDYMLLFTLSALTHGTYEGYAAAEIKSRNSIKIGDLDKTNFEQWPSFILQLLFYCDGIFDLKEPFQRKIRFKAGNLFKQKKVAPILMREAYLYQIDAAQNAQPIQAEKVKESLFEPDDNTEKDKSRQMPPAFIVDLHIEKITKNHADLPGSEILRQQLQKFDKTLNQAIISGQEEIIYIHGIGNGSLKKELHKRLRELPNVTYVDNHNMEKFGGGATLVRIT